jgi:hypothetical protein
LGRSKTIEEIARPVVTGRAVLSHARHEIGAVLLASPDDLKRDEQKG